MNTPLFEVVLGGPHDVRNTSIFVRRQRGRTSVSLIIRPNTTPRVRPFGTDRDHVKRINGVAFRTRAQCKKQKIPRPELHSYDNTFILTSRRSWRVVVVLFSSRFQSMRTERISFFLLQ